MVQLANVTHAMFKSKYLVHDNWWDLTSKLSTYETMRQWYLLLQCLYNWTFERETRSQNIAGHNNTRHNYSEGGLVPSGQSCLLGTIIRKAV